MRKVNFVFLALLFLAACSDNNSDSPAVTNILVYDGREILRCAASTEDLTDSAQLLVNDGIDVLSSVCGTPTEQPDPNACTPSVPRLLIHEIRAANETDAEEAGFVNTDSLSTNSEAGFTSIDCDVT
jgi:hypothetical protein